jgi:glycosyltransferase involved in cell wall biosynthesis
LKPWPIPERKILNLTTFQNERSLILGSKEKNLSAIVSANSQIAFDNQLHRQRLIENQLFIYDQAIQDLLIDNKKRQAHIDLQKEYLDYLNVLLRKPIKLLRDKQDVIENQSKLIERYHSKFGIQNVELDQTLNQTLDSSFFRVMTELFTLYLCKLKGILIRLENYFKNKSYKNSILWVSARFFYYRCIEIIKKFFHKLRNYFPIYLGKLYIYEPSKKVNFKSFNKTKLDEWPIISIVTPSFNSGPYIKKTIESVMNQDYPNLEYYIQDNFSNDGTQQILENLFNTFTVIKIEEDSGQSDAINRGFKNSNGELMSWINADDIYAPGVLMFVASYFKNNPDVDVLYGDRLIIDENDYQIGHWVLPKHNEEIMKWVDFVPQETMFWRRSIWNKIGGSVNPNLRFAMDWDLILRFQKAGAKIVHIPKYFASFRVHKMQKTSNMEMAGGIEEMKLLRKRSLGFIPSDNQINLSIKKYLLRHRIINKFTLLKGFI